MRRRLNRDKTRGQASNGERNEGRDGCDRAKNPESRGAQYYPRVTRYTHYSISVVAAVVYVREMCFGLCARFSFLLFIFSLWSCTSSRSIAGYLTVVQCYAWPRIETRDCLPLRFSRCQGKSPLRTARRAWQRHRGMSIVRRSFTPLLGSSDA